MAGWRRQEEKLHDTRYAIRRVLVGQLLFVS